MGLSWVCCCRRLGNLSNSSFSSEPDDGVSEDKQNELKDTLAEIPREILEDILTRLPMKSLRRFKCVSNEWCNMISSPYFRQLRNRRSSSDFGGLLILLGVKNLYSFDYHNIDQGATQLQFPVALQPFKAKVCNGLLCFELPYWRFALYNPATQTWKKLPEIGEDIITKRYNYISYEFAYDSLSHDYKVIIIVSHKFQVDCKLHVYSLRANSWEILQLDGTHKVHIINLGFDMPRSVLTNNSLQRLVTISVKGRVIWCLDLSTLKYQEIALPRDLSDSREVRLANLKGCLHLITHDFEIWMMEEYGVAQSWTKLFHGIDPSLRKRLAKVPEGSFGLSSPSAHAYSKDGMNILVAVWNRSAMKYICCDIEHQTASEFEIPGLPIEMSKACAEPWAVSNVPLDQ